MRSSVAQNINLESDAPSGKSLYDRLGGRHCLERVHKRLYDKLFAHPVLGAFFVGKDQRFQEDQQTDFLAAAFGGPSRYSGRLPDGAHQHLFITDAHFEMRRRILSDILDECGIDPTLRDQWLAVDHRVKHLIVKKTIDHCKKRYTTDSIIVAPGN